MPSPTLAPYLTIAARYYESNIINKLPQDFKPIGFYSNLHDYTMHYEYFLPQQADTFTYLSLQSTIDQNTNYILILSCLNEEY